ncbi:MAG: hypothetical protein HC831_12430 [Chloroflexia bacterium]|nr:hypothetical protein [Chloroflexia bacterium]
MKRINYTIVFVALISGLLLSCKDKEPEESCNQTDIGELCTQLDIEILATFCSDGESNSYYTYNDKKYVCDGVDANTCKSFG